MVGAGVVALGANTALPALDSGNNSALGATSKNTVSGASASLTEGRALTPAHASRALRRAPAPRPAPDWIRPAIGPMSSGFGPRWGTFHWGLDIAAPYGSIVRAAHAGVVIRAGWDGGYGNVVIIQHENGITTRYGHNSKLLVHVGQRVNAGDPISRVGSTGDSTGNHCHFEVRIDDKAINPLGFMLARGINLAANVDTAL